MAGKQVYEYPSDEALAEMVAQKGCQATAKELGFSYSTLRSYLLRRGLPTTKGEQAAPGSRTLVFDEGELPNSPWTPEALLKSHGLDTDKWRVVRCRANRWGEEDDPKVQLRVDVEPIELPFQFPDPGKWKPLPKVRKRKKQKVRTAVVLSDFHAPHHDKTLFALTCQYLAEEKPDQIIINGDLMDAAVISRHRVVPGGGYDNPVQENLDTAYAILRQLREVCPPEDGTEIVLLRGNHDERIEHALIDNVAALYRVRAAGDEIPALSLRKLLRLDELQVDYIDEPWDRAKVPVLGNYRLASRHGYTTSKSNPGAKMIAELSGSTLQGHSHRLSFYYHTSHHPEDGPETRLAAEAGCMCEIKDGLGYTNEPQWSQGFLIVKSWPQSNPGPKDDFTVAPAIYLPGRLLLPDGKRYS